jgi:hypothetical protein
MKARDTFSLAAGRRRLAERVRADAEKQRQWEEKERAINGPFVRVVAELPPEHIHGRGVAVEPHGWRLLKGKLRMPKGRQQRDGEGAP